MSKIYKILASLQCVVLVSFLACPTYVLGYAQTYYQTYYQSYYQTYYQSYYQGSYSTDFSTAVGVSGSNFSVTGDIQKGSGTFVIDHPLDPENMLLYHSFVESPDVKNLYDGIAVLDASGEVEILLPEYFEVLNKEVRYQYTAIEAPSSGVYVKQEVKNNRFILAGGTPHSKIAWQITASRQDPYILANPIIPEVEKGPDELVDKGEYLFDGYAQ